MRALMILLLLSTLLLAFDCAYSQTWTQTSASTGANAVACSADGMKVMAVFNNWIYISTNSGTTWTSNTLAGTILKSVAASADGTKWIMASALGGIYRSEEHTSELQSLRHLVCR